MNLGSWKQGPNLRKWGVRVAWGAPSAAWRQRQKLWGRGLQIKKNETEWFLICWISGAQTYLITAQTESKGLNYRAPLIEYDARSKIWGGFREGKKEDLSWFCCHILYPKGLLMLLKIKLHPPLCPWSFYPMLKKYISWISEWMFRMWTWVTQSVEENRRLHRILYSVLREDDVQGT